MKLVKEHIFKRGIDPKDAMQTGNVMERKVKKYRSAILKTLRSLAGVDHGTKVVINEDEPLLFTAGFTCKNQDYYLFITYNVDGLHVGYTELKGSEDYVQRVPDIDDDMVATIDTAVDMIENWDSGLSESLKFTRGEEPKKSMNIGKTKIDNELIDNIKWTVSYPRLKHIYDVVEFTEFNGFPILILKNKSSESWNYRATSILPIYTDYFNSAEDALKAIKEEIEIRLETIRNLNI